MAIEGEPKQTENFIGDASFGITLEAVQAHAFEIQKELAEINVELTKGDLQEGLRKFCKDRKVKIEGLLPVSPDEIFRSLQEIYDFVHQMEKKGVDKSHILQKMTQEKPELIQAISKFYDILRSQVWGYRLGQELFAFRAKRPS